ncbi:hypothetical protein NPIL_503231 [Nephila pilipes]|uniref:Uncharacterized protein n=1 Tax=Nephila pilipes TaxID=299642 RepID=A0A8X6QEY2_NEPPI|nr:hypothetical protein NPIL_503231 [Nephila pilipes]
MFKVRKFEGVRKLSMEGGALELRVKEVIKAQEYIKSIKRKNSETAKTAFSCNSYKEELKVIQMKNKELENKVEANKDAVLIFSPVI